MPFPTKQKFKSSTTFPAIERVGAFSETGVYFDKFQNASELKLPDCDSTDLKKLIAAGVDLKQMNTKVINVKSVNLPEEKQVNENSNPDEVNHEN